MRSATGYIIILLFLLTDISYSQSYHFEKFSTKEGLSSNETRTILQDKHDFIWIATAYGLNRFDGISFTNFFHEPDDTNSLSGNSIYCMTEFANKYLVIGTNNGVSIFNLELNCFQNSRIRLKTVNSAPVLVRGVFGDGDGNLWINSNGQLDVYDPAFNFKFRFTDLPAGKILKGINLGFVNPVSDKKHNLWIPSDNMGLVFIEASLETLRCSKNSTDSFMLLNAVRGFLFDDENHSIWISYWGRGLWKYDLNSYSLEKYVPKLSVSILAPDNQTFNGIIKSGGKIFCASEGAGLIEFIPKTKHFRAITHDDFDAASISSNALTYLYKDKNSNIWISGSGLNKSEGINQSFHYLSGEFKTGKTEKIPELLCMTLYNSDTLLVGTEENGLYIVDLVTGTSRNFSPYPSSERLKNTILRIYVDRNKNIWAGTFSGFLIFDIKQNKFRTPPPPFSFLPPEETAGIYEDSYGDYWFSFRHFFLIHCSEGEINRYHYDLNSKTNSIPLPFVSRFTEDRRGNLWLSCPQSLPFLKWNRITQKFESYPQPDSTNENYFESISDLWTNSGDTIWLTSMIGHGLIQYVPGKNAFLYFGRKEGMKNEIVRSIVPDHSGNFWLGTDGGLSFFNISKNKFLNFSTRDGLPEEVFRRSSAYDSQYNIIYMLQPHAVTFFKPEELIPSSPPEKIFITHLQVSGRDTFFDFSQPLILPWFKNHFSIDFTCVNFRNPGGTQFTYKMEGLDEQWTEGSKRRFATYSNLDPGNYIFKVKAVQNDLQSKSTATIIIKITPPFWKTWWFRLLVFLFIISCLYLIVVRRIRKIRKEEKQKTIFNIKFAEVEMKALRAQMNPHFIFNSLNSIHRFILSNDTEKASHYLTTFSKLIRMILENSEKKSISLENEIELLKIYLVLEENRFKTKFDYFIHTDEQIDKQKTELPSMLIQPYVENAIWHGLLHKETRGLVKISFSKNGEGINCVIEDNGIGREKALQLKRQTVIKQQSMAMKITKERLNLLGTLYRDKPQVTITDLKNEHGEPTGTKVEIYIPMEE